MIDFDRWLDRQIMSHADRLEEAGIVFETKDGRYLVTCCVCGEDDELPVDIEEIGLDYVHFCGGSPRCCP